MSVTDSNRSISGSFFWKLLERTGTQGILLVISIIVARILSPHEYGILAIQMIFISLANSLVQNGLNIALVQKKEISTIDYSTGFVLSLFVSIGFYVLIFWGSPFISSFYEMPELELSLRVLAVVLIINAFTVVQNAYVMRNMLFKELAISSFISSLLAGLVSIACAYIGLGLWALVIQQLLSNVLLSFLLILSTRWRPGIGYSPNIAASLFKFSIPVAGSAFLDTLYGDIRNLIIGKIFSSFQLGVYERSKQFPKLITTNVSNTIQSVILPVFSRKKDNLADVVNLLSKTIQLLYVFILPSIFFIFVSAKPLIVTLLTEKWIQCVPIMQASCVMCLFWPLHAINNETVIALGFSKTRFYTELVSKVLDVAALVISLIFFRTILGIAVCAAIASFLSAIVYSYPCAKHLSFGIIEQFRKVLPISLYCILSCVIMYIIGEYLQDNSDLIILTCELFAGSLVYLACLRLFSRELLEQIKRIFIKKNSNSNE